MNFDDMKANMGSGMLGEIKPECMPDWAKEALAKVKGQEKAPKHKDLER